VSTIEKATTNEPYVLPRDAGVYDVWFPSTPRQPGRYLAKVAGKQTDGRLSQVHIVEPRGAAPPMHLHHNADETFYVISGEVSVFLGDERIDAGPGAFLFVPKGAAHTWLVRSEQAEALVTLAPAGLEGFFAEVGVPVVPAEPGPSHIDVDLQEMNRRAEAYGVQFLGAPADARLTDAVWPQQFVNGNPCCT
jgi:mannose-6-phosphate isomerase-like protein (cupin superfamily)